jgi:asparagine synthase (glutamine-hydrolysing)
VIGKCRTRAASGQFSNTDNMAVVGLLSTQVIYDRFIRRRPEGGAPVPLRTEVSFATGDSPALASR